MTRLVRRPGRGAGVRLTVAGLALTVAAVVAPLGMDAAAATVLPQADPSPTATDATATADPTASPTPDVSTPSPTSPAPAPAPTTSSPTPTTTTPTTTATPPTVKAPAPHTATAPLVAPAAASGFVSSSFVSPHGPYDMTSDQCAMCHRTHTAQSSPLLVTASPQSVLCFTCHDGTGSSLNVEAQYTDPTVPANDPATASYYSHDVSKPTAHTLQGGDEFGNTLNRHTECGDCHNPHRGSPTDSTSSPAGTAWTPSGRIDGISGLLLTNAGNGQAPSYAWQNGTSAPLTAEYQLCMKCHSGFTKLLARDPAHPSRDMLDAGVEFNPANLSFHPVEAAGRNQTPKMALSLSGPSGFKRWNLAPTDTVRCTNCHASPSVVTNGSALSADAPPHAATFRGILIAKYEDRVLIAGENVFDESNFALCFLCHTDTPFTKGDTSATNFGLHQKHTASIGGVGNPGAGRDIDTPGDGQGNALCAECHFRPHSTATTPNQYTRLVSFAPDVQPLGSTLSWTPGSTGSGSCTLVCHGFEHFRENYSS